MKKHCFGVFLSAVLAGIMISIGGAVYLNLLSQGQKVAGALLFAVGLFTIIIFKLHLYTGKVGYLPLPGDKKVSTIVFTILGNIVGTALMGICFASDVAREVVTAKLDLSLWRAFLLAIPCGILMFVAVDGYKKAESDAAKGIIVLFAVATFILSGFEHSVADMFYFAAAGKFSAEAALFIAVVILGNGIGGAGFAYIADKITKLIGGEAK